MQKAFRVSCVSDNPIPQEPVALWLSHLRAGVPKPSNKTILSRALSVVTIIGEEVKAVVTLAAIQFNGAARTWTL